MIARFEVLADVHAIGWSSASVDNGFGSNDNVHTWNNDASR